MRGKDIENEAFPEPGKRFKTPFSIQELLDMDGEIWKAKKDKGLSLKTEIKEATLPKKFKSIESDLRLSHSIKELKWGEKLVLAL
jgi:hypothetical protein